MAQKQFSFYQLLQLSPIQLNQLALASPDRRKRRYYKNIILLRSLLIVAFAILFIVISSLLFGKENSSIAVAFLCILMQSQFVGFDYNIKATLVNFAIICVILAFSGSFIPQLPALGGLIVNFILLFAIAVMTCDKPQMGNVGIYVFAYLFATYFPPANKRDFYLRLLQVAADFILCALILYQHHRKENSTIKFSTIVRHYSFKEEKCRWQFRLALGISLGLFIGQAFHLPRYFWVGVASLSILSPYKVKLKSRVFERILGVVIGSLLFGFLYSLIPHSAVSLLGPLGGLLVGFTTTYRWSTAFNCFGALVLAAAIYGHNFSVILRIFNNILGSLMAALFIVIFALITKHLYHCND